MSSAERVSADRAGCRPLPPESTGSQVGQPLPPGPPNPVDKVTHIMAQPERDDRGLLAGLEKPHGAGVAENVGPEPFVAQRGAGPLSDDSAALAASGRLRTPRSLCPPRNSYPSTARSTVHARSVTHLLVAWLVSNGAHVRRSYG